MLKPIAALAIAFIAGLCAPAPPSVETIAIIHTNDIHGAIAAETVGSGAQAFQFGGLDSLVSAVLAAREANPRSVVLDAGDMWQGSFASNQNRGRAVTAAMNLARYDAAVLGNHDFDWGQEVLAARAKEAQFPFLGANIVNAQGEVFALAKPYIVKQVGSVRLGILGIGNPGTPAINQPKNLTGLRFLGAEETARRWVPIVRSESDIVVALTHIGVENDERLAREVPGIDIIIGGHSHTDLRAARRVGSTVIAQAGANAKQLGILKLTVDPTTKKLLDVQTKDATKPIVASGSAPNPVVGQLARRALDEAEIVTRRVIGHSLVDLDSGYAGEFPFGNLIVDAMRAYDVVGDGRIADLAMHNNAGVRASLKAGPLTYGALYQAVPFDNAVVALELTGAQILIILDHSVSGRPGNMLISGGSFVFDAGRDRGKRVLRAFVGGQPLDPARIYRINTLDYLATGGDGQVEFRNAKNLVYGPLEVDVIADYITARSPVSPVMEGRIVAAAE